ncbi:MAG: universal stress protein [Bacteroidota bacterium]
MKTILVPTDFSETADNAVSYAAEIGKLTGGKLILFHVILVPVIGNDTQSITAILDELEADCEEKLKKIESKLYLQYGEKLSVQHIYEFGNPVEEINRFTSRHKVDLIIMGMQGAGYLAERFIGSVTTSLIYKSMCPVLTIDKAVKFRNIKKIVLAYDYEETGNKKILEPLKKFVQFFKAHVYILNVVPELEAEIAPAHGFSDFTRLEHALVGVDHTFQSVSNEETVEGINQFVATGKMDMVVMIPHKHSIFTNMFVEPTVKRMAFHSEVPLLTLH